MVVLFNALYECLQAVLLIAKTVVRRGTELILFCMQLMNSQYRGTRGSWCSKIRATAVCV